MPLSSAGELRECEVMSLEIESHTIDEQSSGPQPVILVRLPNTNAIWGCVQLHPFGPPKMLVIDGRPWGIESNIDTKGIRVMRLRKIGTRQRTDIETVLPLVQKEFGSHRLVDHFYTSLPLTSLLPRRLLTMSDPSGFEIRAVVINLIEVHPSVIRINGSMDNKQLALTFDLSWNLKEFRLAGEVIEFDRDKWSRAYAVWKKALEKEIVETEK